MHSKNSKVKNVFFTIMHLNFERNNKFAVRGVQQTKRRYKLSAYSDSKVCFHEHTGITECLIYSDVSQARPHS